MCESCSRLQEKVLSLGKDLSERERGLFPLPSLSLSDCLSVSALRDNSVRLLESQNRITQLEANISQLEHNRLGKPPHYPSLSRCLTVCVC